MDWETMNNKNRTKCTIWSRVVGYLRPIDAWNDGKKSEFLERVEFEITKGDKLNDK